MTHKTTCALDLAHAHDEQSGEQAADEHGHSHGLVDRSILRSRAGIRARYLRQRPRRSLGQTVERFIHPRDLSHLWLLAAAGVIGFVGNEVAAQVRLRAGRKLDSPALVADGNHARVDGFVSVGVIGSAAVVALGLPVADPVIGLVITLVILKITWDSWHTVRGDRR